MDMTWKLMEQIQETKTTVQTSGTTTGIVENKSRNIWQSLSSINMPYENNNNNNDIGGAKCLKAKEIELLIIFRLKKKKNFWFLTIGTILWSEIVW
jgi:hypothetical protein